MKRIFPLLAVMLMGFGWAVSADALLIENGDGTITDDDLGIMWLADANLAATNPFGVSGIETWGGMTWNTANSWIAGMNAANHLGFNDWRLPTTLDPDPSCTDDIAGTIPSADSEGYNCTGSEMGHLFYDELGGTAGSSILTSGDPDLALFTNILSKQYWSGTQPTPFDAWVFRFDHHSIPGRQSDIETDSEILAWAVASRQCIRRSGPRSGACDTGIVGDRPGGDDDLSPSANQEQKWCLSEKLNA